MGVASSTLQSLRDRGHDAVHLVEQHLERLPDAAILAKARLEDRVVLTFDLDFGDLLAAAGSQLPSVVTFRLHDQSPGSVLPRLLQVLDERALELERGAIVIVEDARYRVRLLPIRPAES